MNLGLSHILYKKLTKMNRSTQGEAENYLEDNGRKNKYSVEL